MSSPKGPDAQAAPSNAGPRGAAANVERVSLTESERYLLEWLSREDYSQYGECHGKDLDALISAGIARIHGPGEHQSFIANDWSGTKGMMYRAVSLTDAGWVKAKELRDV